MREITSRGAGTLVEEPDQQAVMDLPAVLIDILRQRPAPDEGEESVRAARNFVLDIFRQLDGIPHGQPAAESAVDALEIVEADGGSGECPICQEALAAEEVVTRMPCKHLFHTACVQHWLSLHNTCPTCRHELPAAGQEPKRRRVYSRSRGRRHPA